MMRISPRTGVIFGVAFLFAAGFAGFAIWNANREPHDITVVPEKPLWTERPLYEVAALWESIENSSTSSVTPEANAQDKKDTEVAAQNKKEEESTTATDGVFSSFVKQVVKKIVGCPKTYAPVCGADGVTYDNSCLATEAGAWIKSAGECAASVGTASAASAGQESSPVTSAVSQSESNTDTEPMLETPLSGAYPDFIVKSLSYYGNTLSEGKPLSFSVVVKNQGTERAFEKSYVGLYLDIGNDNTFDRSFTAEEVHALEKNEETMITSLAWKDVWIQVPGTHTIGACADSTKVITESLEQNNCETLEFTVPGKEQNADLAVLSLGVSPTSPVAGTNVTFTAQVKNSGGGVAAGPYFGLWVDESRLSNMKASNLGLLDPDFAIGEEDTLTWKTIWRATATEPWEHTYKVCADVKEEIPEVNEVDNCKEGTFTVSAN